MEQHITFWAPAYGLDLPRAPQHRSTTPVKWRRQNSEVKITLMTEEKSCVKQQAQQLELDYRTELFNTYRSLKYYQAEQLPMLEEYVLCPTCQRPINTLPHPTQTIINTHTGQAELLKESEVYCQCCGTTYTENQIETLLDLKYQRQNELDEQYMAQALLEVAQ